jgi:dihydroorotase
MTSRITIRKPDDWHLHVRDGAMLKAVMPFTARHFGRAILMPNLIPPVTTTKDAVAYRERVMAALPKGSTFQPLMTCYLTDDTNPEDVERGFKAGVFTGVKLYPANATTNSAAGVTDYRKVMPVLERMEKIGMPFLMHGEDVDPEIDIFDREAMFIERYLSKWTRQFPGLRFILEHLSSKDGVDFVRSAAPQVGGTITPYHLILTRTDWLGWGLKPYMYCMPVIKTAKDRAALRKAATSGEPCYFLGTDSAPHPMAKKLAVNGIPGLFNAPVAIETTPRYSRRKVHSTGSKLLLRSTARSTIACRPTRSGSRSKRPRGLRPRRSRSRGRTRRRWSIAAAKRSSGRLWPVEISACHGKRKRGMDGRHQTPAHNPLASAGDAAPRFRSASSMTAEAAAARNGEIGS